MGFTKFAKNPTWDTANNEIVLGTAVARPKYKAAYQVKLKFEIGFEDIPAITGQPIVGILHKMARIVDGILTGLERESRRIGLFP